PVTVHFGRVRIVNFLAKITEVPVASGRSHAVAAGDGVVGPAGLSTTASLPTVGARAWIVSGLSPEVRDIQHLSADVDRRIPMCVSQGRRMIFTAPSCFF